ncbi:MAG: hypothetical protein KAS49_07435 [Candidatus Cloacimonetes bacterium]|nr:hypothetical protein [Candidatus Cloacimonadota bacterium]
MKKKNLLTLIIIIFSLVIIGCKESKEREIKGKEIFEKTLEKLGDVRNFKGVSTKGEKKKQGPEGAPGNLFFNFSSIIVFPDKIKYIGVFPMGNQEITINGNDGSVETQARSKNLTPSEIIQFKNNLRRTVIGILKFHKEFTISFLKEEEIDGKPYHFLLFKNKEMEFQLIIDKETNLPYQFIYEEVGKQERKTICKTIEEYKDFARIKYPIHTIARDNHNNKISVTKLYEVKFLTDVNKNLFTKDAELPEEDTSAKEKSWEMSIELDMQELIPPAVQWVIFDIDPVSLFKNQVRMMRNFELEQEQAAKDSLEKKMSRIAGITTSWNSVFRRITGDQIYLLTSAPGVSHGISSNTPEGKKWLVTKTVNVEGKPICWCLPIETKYGEEIKVKLTKDNIFDLAGIYHKLMQEENFR